MALSPFQRHRARILAEQASAASPYGKEMQGSEYQLMQAKLAADRRTLKALQSIARKRQTKAELLPDYLPWIDGALASGQGAQDTVLTTVMVWAIDAGAYRLALQIAPYVLQHGLKLPDQYERTTATVLVDEFAAAYLSGQWQSLSLQTNADGTRCFVPSPSDAGQAHALLTDAGELTANHDVPDPARAKLCKAQAYACLGKVQTAETPDLDQFSKATLELALGLLQQALQLDSLSGVKKDIERIERKLRAADSGRSTLATSAANSASQQASTVNNKTTAKTTTKPTAKKLPPQTPEQPAARKR